MKCEKNTKNSRFLYTVLFFVIKMSESEDDQQQQAKHLAKDVREKFKTESPQMSVVPVATIGNVEAFIAGECFVSYRDRVETFFMINRVEENMKTAYFIGIAGSEVYKTLKSLCAPTLPSKLPFDSVMTVLEKHYAPKVNLRAERFKFQRAVQHSGESVNEFLVRLRSLAETCKFGQFIPADTPKIGSIKNLALEDALLDRFIVGLKDNKIQQVLLNKDTTIDFDRCCEIANNMEMSQKEQAEMHPSVNVLHQGRSKSKSRGQSAASRSFSPASRSKSRSKHVQFKSKSKAVIQPCKYCGKVSEYHKSEKCPAKEWMCFVCNKKGHTSRVCTQKDKEMVNHLGTVNRCVERFIPPAELRVQVENKQIDMEIDTGAGSSFISKQESGVTNNW